jgi:hypothetical protein
MTNRIELRTTERIPFADGHGFDDVGAYERLSGRAHFAVDPHAAAQAGIVDLDNAPRDESGLVRFAADFMILKPCEMQRGNRRVFYDYGNRGHKRALQFYNDAPHSNAPITLAHAGNGFFMRRGYAVAWLAWEGDMLPGDGRMVLCNLDKKLDHIFLITKLALLFDTYPSEKEALAALALSV